MKKWLFQRSPSSLAYITANSCMRKKKDLSNIKIQVIKLSAPSTKKWIISNIPHILPTFLYSIHLAHNTSDSHSSLPFWPTAISPLLLVLLIFPSCVLRLQAAFGPGTTWGAGAAASCSLADVFSIYHQVFPISCSSPALSPCSVCVDHENHSKSSWKCWSQAHPIQSPWTRAPSQDSSFIPCNPVNLCALPQPQHIMGSDLSASLEK